MSRYAGTVDGLAGLVADLYVAGVADGVTLIPVTPDADVREYAQDALSRIRNRRGRASYSESRRQR
jgi:hypothetical protein